MIRWLGFVVCMLVCQQALAEELDYQIQRTVAHSGFNKTSCWVHARAGIVPGDDASNPTVVMTTQPLLLSGSDVFGALRSMRTEDLGATWSPLRCQYPFRRLPGGKKDVNMTVCDFTPQWHAASSTLLGIGHTVWYENNKVMRVRPRATAYSALDPETGKWKDWKKLQMPDEPKFANAGAGSVQRVDLEDGTILLPIYFKKPEVKQYSVTVCQCRFDGDKLQFEKHGSELTIAVKRGLYEPSLTKWNDRFYLTMRNDDHGYVATSDDGLSFTTPRKWAFDDGSDLGNYNTQQHWVTHSDGLFLVYTRRGANNDHVFRHRAPLFVAQVDPAKPCVIRESERVLVPERGARLGNFGVVNVTPHETWVTVAEWMQPVGVEKYGSDNSIYVAKMRWNQPNRLLVAK